MGLFDFLAEKGSQIFGTQTEGEQGKEKSAKVETFVRELGLRVENFKASVDGQTATITGTAATGATREKIVLAVGNIEGIGKVDDKLEVKAEEVKSQFHDVKSGDTLSKIAAQYYGNPKSYQKIFEANQPMLQTPDKIYPGQKLRIPEAQA